MEMESRRIRYIAEAGVIAAVYTAVTMIFAVFVQPQVLFHIKTSPTGQKNSRNSTMTHVLPNHGPPAGAPPTG